MRTETDAVSETSYSLRTLSDGKVQKLRNPKRLYSIKKVPGGKVCILVGHSIGHYKQKELYTYKCPIPNGFRDRAISL
jgi:hypothetical protein